MSINPKKVKKLAGAGVRSVGEIIRTILRIVGTVLLIVILLALPFAGTFIGGGDVVLTLNDHAVMGTNGRTEYVIELEDVQSVQLMEELPDNMVRNFGTAMPQLLKGDFTASEIGHVKVCLDPTVPPFLLIENNEGKAYLLGSRTDGVVKEVYEVLHD